MRFIAYILSLYILVLTVIPCHDEHRSSGKGNVQISQLATENTQESPDIDFCSPFCDCNCCASITFQEKLYIDFTCDSYFPIQFPKYISEFYSSGFASIWQPPKLV